MAAAIAAILGLVIGASYFGPPPAPVTTPPTPGRPAVVVARPGDLLPSITLPDLDGHPVDLATFRGRPLLINVWASWCGPCVEEMPALQAFAAAQPVDGVQVLGMAIDTPEGVRAFLSRVPVHYPIVLEQPAPDDASVKLGNAQGLLPYSVLVDASGRILKQKLGPFSHGEIEHWAQP